VKTGLHAGQHVAWQLAGGAKLAKLANLSNDSVKHWRLHMNGRQFVWKN